MLKMSMGQRSRSWTMSRRKTPMRVVGLEANSEVVWEYLAGWGSVVSEF